MEQLIQSSVSGATFKEVVLFTLINARRLTLQSDITLESLGTITPEV